MKEPSTADIERGARQKMPDPVRSAAHDGDELSPSIRQLILSFGGAVSEQTWNAEAYSGQPLKSA
jgi:hypothetical protein